MSFSSHLMISKLAVTHKNQTKEELTFFKCLEGPRLTRWDTPRKFVKGEMVYENIPQKTVNLFHIISLSIQFVCFFAQRVMRIRVIEQWTINLATISNQKNAFSSCNVRSFYRFFYSSNQDFFLIPYVLLIFSSFGTFVLFFFLTTSILNTPIVMARLARQNMRDEQSL